MELAPWGLHVAVVEPGTIATEMPRKLRRDADYVLASLPPEGRERYGKALDTYVRTLAAHAHNGTPPEVVAAAVVHALTSPRPRIRYTAGAPADAPAAATATRPGPGSQDPALLPASAEAERRGPSCSSRPWLDQLCSSRVRMTALHLPGGMRPVSPITATRESGPHPAPAIFARRHQIKQYLETVVLFEALHRSRPTIPAGRYRRRRPPVRVAVDYTPINADVTLD
jgi:plasmid stabilization system protein ParE